MNQFKQKYGQRSQPYFKAYEEKLVDGSLYPETLAQVI